MRAWGEIYDLRGKEETSNQYYKAIYHFAYLIKEDLEQSLGKYIRAYEQYVALHKHEHVRDSMEYYVELLALGVLWRAYGGKAELLKDLPGYMAIIVAKARQKSKYHKAFLSKVKGQLASKYLVPKVKGKNYICDIDKLIFYLAASGEFDEEVIRFKAWQRFIHDQSFSQRRYFEREILLMAGRFEVRAHKYLNKYTKGVELFRRLYINTAEGREDQIFCMRKSVEYHLNMVGAVLLNDVYRKKYLKVKTHVIFLPQCMCIRKQACLAQKEGDSYKCVGCTSECPVNKVNGLAKLYSSQVVILGHQSALHHKRLKERTEQVGVIGVCCILGLIEGGFKARRLGYVPQCVLLDYCGCKTHWDEDGRVTQINMDYLTYILGEEQKNIIMRKC